MFGTDRPYKIWPGPCRLKSRRCLILSIAVTSLLIFLMLQIHLGDKWSGKGKDSVPLIETSDMNNFIVALPPAVAYDVEGDLKTTEWNGELTTKGEDLEQVVSDETFRDQDQVTKLVSEKVTALTTLYPTSRSSVQSSSMQTISKEEDTIQVPEHWRTVQTYNFKSANVISVSDGGLRNDNGIIDLSQKHLFILGHYEQLGKTTINYMEAAKLAFLTNRKIVKPFVGDSRFCGLTSGWTGSLRSGTRLFKPLNLYYDVAFLENTFRKFKLADMEYLSTFKESCSFRKTGRKIVIVYFMYPGYDTKYLMLSNREDEQIKHLLSRSEGWVDCTFINNRIKIDVRIGDEIKAGKQFCVDIDKLRDVKILENKVLRNNPCVVFHQWQGTGFQRTHFNLTITPPPENLLMMLQPSRYVIAEVMRTIQLIGPKFIGVHIRSERQLLWYGLDKWMRCMDLVYREVNKVRHSKRLNVFISADVGRYGSDQIPSNFNKTDLMKINSKYLWLVKKLNAVTYSVVRPRHYFWTDRGLVALVQANILSLASNLVTLGAGTFQKWITDKFKARKDLLNDQSWTITKVCYSELKNWHLLNDLKKATKKG